MNAGLIHFYSTDNVGDAAILAAMERMVGGRLSVLDFDSRSEAKACDALISVGGDIFNNGRPGLLTRRLLQKFEQLRWAPEQTLLFGQSIPPSCRGIAFQMLAYHLRRIASVTVRDPLSYTRLRAKGVNANLSVDTAFALEGEDANIPAAKDQFAANGLAAERTVVFSIRNFGKMYPINADVFRSKITETMELFEQRDYQVAVLLQADVDESDTDQALARELQQSIPNLKILDPFQSGQEPWRVALGITAIARAVVGTRYHTNIFRMIGGGMPVSLAYSNKGEDLNDRLGVLGASADSFRPNEIVAMAEQAVQMRFDPEPLRMQVRTDFDAALARVRIAGVPKDTQNNASGLRPAVDQASMSV